VGNEIIATNKIYQWRRYTIH